MLEISLADASRNRHDGNGFLGNLAMKSGYALLLAALVALPVSARAADGTIWSEPLDPIIVTATNSAAQHGEAMSPGVQNVIDNEPLPQDMRAERPLIAIVIDDMGLDRARNPMVVNLPKEVTLSYLPYSPNVRWQTENAINKGHELLLHMPMEPERKTANPGPNYLGANMNPLELQDRLTKNLSAFTGFVGINNHMGSKLTCARDALAVVMAELKERGLSFLDSRTGNCATAETVARQYGLKTTHRDIFIDHTDNATAVAAALAGIESAARRTGSAIAIGHPKDNTIAGLARWLPTLEGKGFKLVPVSKVIELRSRIKPSTAFVTAPKKQGPVIARAAVPEPVPAIEPIRLVEPEEVENVTETIAASAPDGASAIPVTPVLAHVTSDEMAVTAPVVVEKPAIEATQEIAAIPTPVPAEEPVTAVIENMDENGNIIAPPALKPSPRFAGLSYKTDATPLETASTVTGITREEAVEAAETHALKPSPRIEGLSYETGKPLNN